MEVNLERFIEAQTTSYEIALREIQNGKKSSHWMWYIFPQIKDLGKSSTAKFYAINSKEEALSYYNHPILGTRLREITTAFLFVEGKSALEILGSPDHLKMRSCMTLFLLVQEDTNLFFKVLEKYYNGQLCEKTRKQLEVWSS